MADPGKIVEDPENDTVVAVYVRIKISAKNIMGLGLHSAIHIAHMGMGAAEKTINVSGNNLANANTYGYKSERADFSSFLSYTYKYGSTPGQTYTAGTNPLQIGMGVELASVTTDFTQGSFKEGMTNSDVAINGNGFLIVQYPGDSNVYYTRNGALKINQNQELTTNTGLYVMGYGIDDQFRVQDGQLVPITIPIGEMHIAEQTSMVKIEGILDAVGDSGTQGTLLRTKQMTDLSKTYSVEGQAAVSTLTKPNVEGVTKAAGSASATGALETGNYQYCFAFVDDAGQESDFSIPIPAEVQTGQNAVNLSGLPNIPEGYSSLRVYRAIDTGDASATLDFHLVGETATPANTFLDTVSNADAALAPELNQERLGKSASYSYQYYMTFYDELGNESRPVAISDPKNVNNGQLSLTDIPTLDGENTDNWVGRRIYRNSGSDDTQIHMVHQIDNMDSGESFIDRVSDAGLVDGSHPEMSLAGRGDVLVNNTTKLVDLGSYENGRFVRVFEEGTLTLDPSKGEKSLKSTTLEITAETTVADYLTFLNESFGIRNESDGIAPDQGEVGSTINDGSQGAVVIDGSFYLLGNAGQNNALEFNDNDMNLVPTDGSARRVDLGWQEIQSTVGSSTATDIEVYDSLGTPIQVRMTMVLESKNDKETVYRWYADSPDNQPLDGTAIAAGTGVLRFDQHGKLIEASNTTISVERTSVASVSPLDFDFQVNIDSLMALATGSANIAMTEQDGAAAGTLYDYQIQEDGTVTGIFDTGDQRTLGRIPLATFRNQEGLYKSGDSLYQASTNSGSAIIGTAGQEGVGKFKSNSLELSNTDIAQEIVDMILASSMYRANAKVMTTSNEMYDALLRIV